MARPRSSKRRSSGPGTGSPRPDQGSTPGKAEAVQPAHERGPAIPTEAGNGSRVTTLGQRVGTVLCLVAGTLAIYWQVGRFEFVNFDDPTFVSANQTVQAGLTGQSVAAAFTRPVMGEWHPLTTLSHMLVVQLFGPGAGPQHLVNAGLHLANALLLLLVLQQMTGRWWCSALVAALFAWHPLRVESVAWVSERKDVLSGLFWMLTTWAYLRYVRQPGAGRYLLLAVLFVLGLMAKAMLITLPFVFLLLDYWPLGRMQLGSGSPVLPDDSAFPVPCLLSPASDLRPPISGFRLVLEKVPLLLCAFGSTLLTFLCQDAIKAAMPLDAIGLPARLANAVVSYARYLGKTFVPVDLAFFYPHPYHWAAWQITAALLLLLALSGLAWHWRRKCPWGLVGWCWFAGTMVPVIGLVQLGRQAMADRFTYLPHIGLFIALVWGGAALAARQARLRSALAPLTALVLALCLGTAWHQTRHWQNSVTLLSHALDVTTDNAVAHNNLGLALQDQGLWDAAEAHFAEAIRVAPGYLEPVANYGLLQLARGNLEEALQYLREMVRVCPGDFLFQANLAQVQWLRGETKDAIDHWQEALRLQPNALPVLNNLAWLRATHPQAGFRDGPEALRLARRACELTAFAEGRALATLAAAQAENGQFKEAVETQQKALALAQTAGQADLAKLLQQTLQLYAEGRPFREAPR
jgi:protein O-mannosyl-transferase